MHPLTDTWNIHNRINLYLLDAVSDDALNATALSKGRSVGEQFAHIHNVRLMWLKAAAPELLTGVEKIEKETINKTLLQQNLTKSGEAFATLFDNAPSDGKIKGFKPHATGFLGYLISHESHHRGQIALSLKQAGYPVDKKILFGLWEWGVR